ncbi:unnamed protein product, partial [Rotaria magnacalcarata]
MDSRSEDDVEKEIDEVYSSEGVGCAD